MKVYDMNSSINGKYFLATAAEKTIQIYDADAKKRIAEFSTHYEFGGKRTCLSNNGKLMAVARYSRFGITLYDVVSKEILWVNKEVKRIQRICFSADESRIYVTNNDDVLYEISVNDGKVVSTKKHISEVAVGKNGVVEMLDHYGNRRIMFNGKMIVPEKGVLSLLIAEDHVFYSNIRGGLVCCSNSGHTVWQVENNEGEHYVKLSYCEKYNALIAIAYKFSEGRTKPYNFFDVYDISNGKILLSSDLDDGVDFTFINNSEKIVSGTGTVFSISDKGVSVEKDQYCFD